VLYFIIALSKRAHLTTSDWEYPR